ncbi:hypothetical protein J1605_022947 [Eschrichtius robustus]|uniref:Uncharacterized protein n=1 Tax=Eschrichtius robustus TaxID=9764 RepID=A0AB34H8F1_ESCRO|nr:hypothetical protein J1605_022947 [Eschrichtius robustus]
MCSSVAAKLWFLTDRRIREDYPQKEILRALKAKCCEEELDFRAVVMHEVVLTTEQGNLGLRTKGELITAYPQVAANANVGFIASDKACNLDVAGIMADYAASLLPSGRLTWRVSLLSAVSMASETSEQELGPPANTTVDNMSASSSSVDSDPETTERELLTKLPGGLSNMNQLLANEIKLLVE